MNVRDTVRVKANRMLGTVLQVRGDQVRVVIGNRPAKWIDEWIALLEKDPHAATPGWSYAKGELEVIPRSEMRPLKAHSRPDLERRLAFWKQEKERGGQYADAADVNIKAIEEELAKRTQP